MSASAARRRQRHALPPTDLGKRVGELVRAARIAKGMSQSQLGAPMTRAVVSAVELGKISPSLETLSHFAARLELRVKDLLPDD